MWCHALLLAVAPKLAAYDFCGIDGSYSPKQAGALLPLCPGMVAAGSIHRKRCHYRQHVVLKDVTDSTCLFIKFPSALDPEVFSHCDLHAGNVITVPDRLEDRVCKTGVINVLDRLLAEEMVDPVN